MDNIYFVMIIALALLAVADLVVGVSNDAVNFFEFSNRFESYFFSNHYDSCQFGYCLWSNFFKWYDGGCPKRYFQPRVNFILTKSCSFSWQ